MNRGVGESLRELARRAFSRFLEDPSPPSENRPSEELKNIVGLVLLQTSLINLSSVNRNSEETAQIETNFKRLWVYAPTLSSFLNPGPMRRVFEANIHRGAEYVLFMPDPKPSYGLDEEYNLLLTRLEEELKRFYELPAVRRHPDRIKIVKIPPEQLALMLSTEVRFMDPLKETSRFLACIKLTEEDVYTFLKEKSLEGFKLQLSKHLFQT